MPIMTMEKLLITPPEKTFINPKTAFEEKNCRRATTSTPGIGMCAAKRKITNMPKTNKILFLKSLAFQI